MSGVLSSLCPSSQFAGYFMTSTGKAGLMAAGQHMHGPDRCKPNLENDANLSPQLCATFGSNLDPAKVKMDSLLQKHAHMGQTNRVVPAIQSAV